METCIIGSFLHILECCCYNIAFDVLLNQLAIAYRTVFSVCFLSSGSENYIIAFCVCSFCIGYSYCSATCFYACDYWLCRCNCRYREWIDVGPFAEYFLTFCITCPSMAVCIISSLLYVVEVTCCLNLVLCYIYTRSCCIVCFGDYIVVTRSTISFSGKDYCCFIADNLNTADYRSTNLSSFFNVNFLIASIVLACRFSSYCSCSISVIFNIIF